MRDDVVAGLKRAARIASGGTWPRALLRLALLACVIAAGAVLYAWSGFVPIAASSGHSPIAYWFLDFAKENGVETQSMGISPPPLDDRALLLKGAGHYATGCAPCHGAPGETRAVIAAQMTPEPPYLPTHLARWDAAELFWIVKHGIKYTGMPAWPVQTRDDEVWALVSFLERLPSMDAAMYQLVAYGNAEAGAVRNSLRALTATARTALANCARCHGYDGMGRGAGVFPVLAGQHEAYLLASIEAYRNAERHSGIMQPAVWNLGEDTLRELAEYFAQLPRAETPPPAPSASQMERGRRIAEEGIPERGIPACQQCHGPGTARNPMYPRLAGQYADYLELQLELFSKGTRGGTPYAHIMNTVTRRMTAEDRRAVALYYASRRSP